MIAHCMIRIDRRHARV